jgi:hypothetical protein
MVREERRAGAYLESMYLGGLLPKLSRNRSGSFEIQGSQATLIRRRDWRWD